MMIYFLLRVVSIAALFLVVLAMNAADRFFARMKQSRQTERLLTAAGHPSFQQGRA
jgi:hypothetical protein